MKSLDAACTKQKVDAEIVPVLQIINKIEGCYTLSSCAGRIVFLEIPVIGDKRGAVFLGIWHRPIKYAEFEGAAGKATKGLLWLLAQSPILHICVQTLELANTLVKTGVSCSFKNSSVKSTGRRIIIEIGSTERLDAPIGKDGIVFCDQRYSEYLVDIANTVIEKSNLKLLRLKQGLRNL